MTIGLSLPGVNRQIHVVNLTKATFVEIKLKHNSSKPVIFKIKDPRGKVKAAQVKDGNKIVLNENFVSGHYAFKFSSNDLKYTIEITHNGEVEKKVDLPSSNLIETATDVRQFLKEYSEDKITASQTINKMLAAGYSFFFLGHFMDVMMTEHDLKYNDWVVLRDSLSLAENISSFAKAGAFVALRG